MVSLEGTFTALVTPFAGDTINEEKIRELVTIQIEMGISGIVPVGTTGESPTLTLDEHRRVIDIVIKAADGRVPIIAGAGSNNTAESVDLVKHAKSAGANAALLITPYYNRPSQAGVIAHYKTVASSCDIPIILYNCPGRTSVNMTADTIVELAAVPTIVGVKEASGSMDQISEILVITDDSFVVLSGDDGMTVPMIAAGARGVISVTSNVIPDRMVAMVSAALSGDFNEAGRLHRELFPLMRTLMKVETNPSPIKSAMNIAGMDVGPVRLPLTTPADDGCRLITACLNDLGVI
jgi:4-hydroxy-tetrahydrodipicolinate synthase